MNTPPESEKATLDDEAIARLKKINVQLDALQMRIHEIAKAYRRQISQAAADLGLPMDAIGIEAELDFCLSPADPRYDPTFEHSDNLVASRTLHCPESPDLLDFGIDEPGSVIGPQGWLFHDLTEHAYGVNQPQVTPVELLQVGDVRVDVVIRQSIKINFTSSKIYRKFEAYDQRS
jgi:hypothetical protein